MAFADFKDHYKTLGLQPQATADDIKKAYRSLALKYHPDTNNGAYAAALFIDIKEAYETLSHHARRRKYDEERWLNGMGSRAQGQVVITPGWILHECRRLSQHMKTIDTYRMSHGALRDYVLLLLADAHMAVLLQTKDKEADAEIIHEILSSTRHLEHSYMQEVAIRLAELAGADSELLMQIHMQVKNSEKQARWGRLMPYVIVIVVLLLCLLMYLWGRR